MKSNNNNRNPMTNAEIIQAFREEIERRIDAHHTHGHFCAEHEFRDVLSFISDLEKSLPTQDAGGSSEISKDLETAAIQATQSDMQDRQIMEASNDERMLYSRIFRRGFKAGVKWNREQMMKEAMEGEVIVPIYEGNDIWSAEVKMPGRYEVGDKVHIIIVKEDEK